MADSYLYNNIVKLCDHAGITRNKLANDLGINSSTIIAWRTRGSLPRGGTVKKIADMFGVDPFKLINGDLDDKTISSSVYGKENDSRGSAVVNKMNLDDPSASQSCTRLLNSFTPPYVAEDNDAISNDEPINCFAHRENAAEQIKHAVLYALCKRDRKYPVSFDPGDKSQLYVFSHGDPFKTDTFYIMMSIHIEWIYRSVGDICKLIVSFAPKTPDSELQMFLDVLRDVVKECENVNDILIETDFSGDDKLHIACAIFEVNKDLSNRSFVYYNMFKDRKELFKATRSTLQEGVRRACILYNLFAVSETFLSYL